MLQDCREKWAQMINSSVKIRESFAFAQLEAQILAVTKYCLAAYGSNLREQGGTDDDQCLADWHKLAWDVSRECRTFLVQNVLAPMTPACGSVC